MLSSISRTLKQVLPHGAFQRRLPFGLAAGCSFNVNFAHDLRLYLGLYELEIAGHFRRLVRPGYRSFDVGGNQGYDGLMLALLGRAEVLSLECEPPSIDVMAANFAANPGLSVRPHLAMVGDVTDGAQRYKLDDLAKSYFVPDFIKMDIEGAEDAALRGAEEILATRRPSLIIEVHGLDKEQACLQILAKHGYHPSIVDRRTWFPEHRPMAHNRWLICEGRP